MSGAMNARDFGDALRFKVPKKIDAQSRRIFLDSVTQLHGAIAVVTPVKSGFLRAGLLASPSNVAPTPIVGTRAKDAKDGQYSAAVAQANVQAIAGIAAAVRGLVPVTVGFTADYSIYVEDKRHMVKQARARWKSFVDTAVKNAGGGA